MENLSINTTQQMGYYAKNKVTGNLHEYHFAITDEGDDMFFVRDMKGDDVEQDVNQYEILEIGCYITEQK